MERDVSDAKDTITNVRALTIKEIGLKTSGEEERKKNLLS